MQVVFPVHGIPDLVPCTAVAQKWGAAGCPCAGLGHEEILNLGLTLVFAHDQGPALGHSRTGGLNRCIGELGG